MPWKTWGLNQLGVVITLRREGLTQRTPTHPPSHHPQGQRKQSSFLTVAWQPLSLSGMTVRHQWHLWPRTGSIAALGGQGHMGRKAMNTSSLALCHLRGKQHSWEQPGPSRTWERWGGPGRQDIAFCYAEEYFTESRKNYLSMSGPEEQGQNCGNHRN